MGDSSLSYSVKYTYDKMNRLTSAAYSNNRHLHYSYDAAGNLLSVNCESEKAALKSNEPMYDQGIKEDAVLKCQSCSSEILPGTKFCIECGTPVDQSAGVQRKNSSLYCASCQQELAKDSKFCTFCGTPV